MTAEATGFWDVAARVRVARVTDARAVAAIYAPYVTDTVISFEIDPPSEGEMAQRMERITPRLPWLVYEDAGQVLGYAYASAHGERAAYRWSVDSGIYVALDARRRGVGRVLYRRLAAILSLQGYHNVYGGITLPNAASVGLHEACGYEPVGVFREVGHKFGAWRDVGWWGLRLNPSAPEPREPQPLTDAIFEESWTLTKPT